MKRFLNYFHGKMTNFVLSETGNNIQNLDKTTDPEQNFDINALPDVVLENIFLNLSGRDLIKNVIYVCKQWHQIIDKEAFWLNKCLNENKIKTNQVNLLHQFQIENCCKTIYFTNCFSGNLLKNPCGDQQFEHWHSTESIQIDFVNAPPNLVKQIIKSYRNNYEKPNQQCWQIETEHNGAEPLHDNNNNVLKNFVTSYYWGGKMQVIELSNQVLQLISQFIEKKLDLKLEISECYTERFDCGSIYKLNVYLINEDYEIVESFSFQDEMQQWSKPKWKTAQKMFVINIPFKYIIFYHGGQDTQFWSGFYGSKMTNGTVKFNF